MKEAAGFVIDALDAEDWESVRDIYSEGILTGQALCPGSHT
jgi:L-amino acid N-acyltransferase YncA